MKKYMQANCYTKELLLHACDKAVSSMQWIIRQEIACVTELSIHLCKSTSSSFGRVHFQDQCHIFHYTSNRSLLSHTVCAGHTYSPSWNQSNLLLSWGQRHCQIQKLENEIQPCHRSGRESTEPRWEMRWRIPSWLCLLKNALEVLVLSGPLCKTIFYDRVILKKYFQYIYFLSGCKCWSDYLLAG